MTDDREHAPEITWDNIRHGWWLQCSCGADVPEFAERLEPLAEMFDRHIDSVTAEAVRF